MKCTQCDSRTLSKINLLDLFSVGGDAWLKKSNTLEIYVCNECGHLEFFDNSINVMIKEKQEIDKKFYNESKTLIEKRNYIKTVKLKELTDLLTSVENQLTSLDITIRQQQELKNRVQKLNIEIQNVNNEIRKINRELNEIERNKLLELQKVESKYNSRFSR